MSDYCRNNAKDKFAELIRDLDAQYLVVSYNNTYDSKSDSSRNKITLQEIEKILQTKGSTKVFEKIIGILMQAIRILTIIKNICL